MTRALIFLLGATLASCAGAPAPLDPDVRSKIDDAARASLASGRHRGLAIGVLVDGRPHVFGYGRLSAESETPPDGKTVFEIGSITKAFTGVLLAQMAAEGIVAVDDPARKHLPPSLDLPARNGTEITLLHLAAHTSGLPRLPSNLAPENPHNPYADYGVDDLSRFLTDCELARDPGAKYEYSNLGMGLLGLILAHKAGRSYEELVVGRLCAPLGMSDTLMTLGGDQERRLAPGHSPDGKKVSNWDIPTFAGAGALRSTADDMLRFLAAQFDARFEAAQAPRHEIARGAQVGLGWHLSAWKPGGRSQVVWHNGGTGGYRSFAGFVRETRTAVVVLANTAVSVDELAMNVLRLLEPSGGVQ